MCNLFGIAGNLVAGDISRFEDLGVIGQLRGRHATGLASVNEASNQVEVHKTAVDASAFFLANEKFLGKILSPKNKVIIGHNRHATVGGNTAANAHPFVAGNIVGAHNGTITDTSIFNLQQGVKYETDSEAVLNSINSKGVEKTFLHLFGAWAFVWYNRKEHRLYFLRNENRTLHYCWTKDLQVLYWASEKEMLRMVMDRKGEFGSTCPIHNNEIYSFEPNVLYSMDIKDVGEKLSFNKGVPIKCSEPKYIPTHAEKYTERPLPSKTYEDNVIHFPNKCAHCTGCKSKMDCFGFGSEEAPESLTNAYYQPPEKNNRAHMKLVHTINEAKFIYGLNIFSAEELKDVDETSLKDLKDKSYSVERTLFDNNEMAYKVLATMNWSDYVTWNENLVSKGQGIIGGIENRLYQSEEVRKFQNRIDKEVIRRNQLKEALAKHREEQLKLSMDVPNPPNLTLPDFKTLANKFGQTTDFTNYLAKHYQGCVNCGECNPFNIEIAECIELKGDMGYVCDSCKHQKDVFDEYIQPYGLRA